MGKILERIPDSSENTTKNFAEYFISTRLKIKKEDFDKGLMILSNGDISQFNELKKISIYDYLTKLDNFISSIEVQTKK